jgi:hypothetical protein
MFSKLAESERVCEINNKLEDLHMILTVNTLCTKMFDTVWKWIIFINMLYRITETSRNERVTVQVYNTYPTSI